MPRLPALLLLLALVGLSACASTAHLDATHHAVARANPDVTWRRTAHVGVGPVTVGLARAILRRVDDPDAREAAFFLRSVRRARVWVFEADGYRAGQALRLAAGPARAGWSTLLRASDPDDGGAVLIQTRERRGRIDGMTVTILDDDHLILLDLGGALDRLVEETLTRYQSHRGDRRARTPEAPASTHTARDAVAAATHTLDRL